MKRLVTTLTALLLIAAVPAGADTREETYLAAVALLEKEGFSGIDRALETFEKLAAEDSSYVAPRLTAAEVYLLKYEFSPEKDPGLLDRALAHADAALALDDRLTAAYFRRAVVYFNREEVATAADDLEKALEIDPLYLDARVLYLQYLLGEKKGTEARKFADASLRHYPEDPMPIKYFGDVFFQEEAFGDAVEYYGKVVALVPRSPYTHLAMGKAHARQGDCARAVEAFTEALEQKPDLMELHVNLSYCYSSLEKFDEAVTHIEKYIKENPRDLSALNNAGLLYEQTGRIQEAQLTWLKLKEADSEGEYGKRAEAHLYRLLTYGEGGEEEADQ